MLRNAESNLIAALNAELNDKAWSEITIEAFLDYCNELKNYKNVDINYLNSYLESIREFVDILSPLSRQAMNAELEALNDAQNKIFQDNRSNEISYVGGGGVVSSRAQFDIDHKEQYERQIQEIKDRYPNADRASEMLVFLSVKSRKSKNTLEMKILN